MAINEALVRGVHATVRAYFKGKTKSSNKMYDEDYIDLKSTPSLKDKITRRNTNRENAGLLINQLRRDRKFGADDILPFGFAVLDQEDVAGNCVEMAAAAAYLVKRENIGTAWFAVIHQPGDHTFCLVDNGVEDRPETIGGARGYRVCGGDSWVIDPWANVCCKMRDYDDAFYKKMQDWSKQGKRVIVASADEDLDISLNPVDYDWMDGFRRGPIEYIKTSDQLPQGIPKALFRLLPQDVRKAKKSGCCVIL